MLHENEAKRSSKCMGPDCNKRAYVDIAWVPWEQEKKPDSRMRRLVCENQHEHFEVMPLFKLKYKGKGRPIGVYSGELNMSGGKAGEA